MGRTRSDLEQAIVLTSEGTVDESIARMARRKMHDVVTLAEDDHWLIGAMNARNAADVLVARLFTDAVFSDDIRSIQLIINRIDGGLPKDVDVDSYKTEFGDAINQVMSMESGDMLKIKPDDTVMLALCKNLYQMAVQDIYWDPVSKRKRRPSEAVKKERDAALRMVLERAGGRKTLENVPKRLEDVEVAPWIAELPSG